MFIKIKKGQSTLHYHRTLFSDVIGAQMELIINNFVRFAFHDYIIKMEAEVVQVVLFILL